MDIVILQDGDAVAAMGASIIAELLRNKPDAVLGLATGNTPLALYRRLIALYESSNLTFSNVTAFNLDEYLGLPDNSPRSYRHYMNDEFFSRIDIDPNNTYLPCREASEDPVNVGPRYERRIRDKGGIDLQVLGIGRNGHVGFNEPTSSLGSRTRVKTLARATVDSNSSLFDSGEFQPVTAITMGIATILDARKIVLLATGVTKADAVHDSFEGPISAMLPASALQLHPNVTVLLDEAAASRLTRRDYYDWVREQKIVVAGMR